jgi:hypothetical protein
MITSTNMSQQQFGYFFSFSLGYFYSVGYFFWRFCIILLPMSRMT